MPYDEDKQLPDESEEVECRIKLTSALLKPTSLKLKVKSALLVPATFSMGGNED